MPTGWAVCTAKRIRLGTWRWPWRLDERWGQWITCCRTGRRTAVGHDSASYAAGPAVEMVSSTISCFGTCVCSAIMAFRSVARLTEGFLASDMIAHALRMCTAAATGYRVDSADQLHHPAGQVHRHHDRRDHHAMPTLRLEDWGVWNDKTFCISPWRCSRRWQHVSVPPSWRRQASRPTGCGRASSFSSTMLTVLTKTVGPPGSGCRCRERYLKDIDPENPANKLGMTRRDKLVMGTSTSRRD